MKIPAVRLSFRAGLVETLTHGVALQRYGWPPYCCTLECKRIRTVSRRWWSFQSLWWSQVLTFVHNRISHPNSLFDMINDYPFEMSNFEMMLSLKWYMTVFSKGATASSILLRWSMTISSKWATQFCIRFDMIYNCPFDMTAQKFSYRESFSSGDSSYILVTKKPRARRGEKCYLSVLI